jgi:hypothetical protein
VSGNGLHNSQIRDHLTFLKEGIKDIAAYRVARGEGVSEDFMIKGR